MIKDFITSFENNKEKLREIYRENHPSYSDIVKNVIEIINPDKDFGEPDPSHIRRLDFGDYQGTLLFIVPAVGYQPSSFWAININYGSCSHCDTLQSIQGYGNGKPNEEQVKDYMNLSLNVVQGISKIGGE